MGAAELFVTFAGELRGDQVAFVGVDEDDIAGRGDIDLVAGFGGRELVDFPEFLAGEGVEAGEFLAWIEPVDFIAAQQGC